MNATQQSVRVLVVGVLFGLTLSFLGFTSWDEVFAMFSLQDLRMVFAFGVAIGILAIAWPLIHRSTGAVWSARKVHRGTLAGGMLFGAGWALCGSCPSGAFVALGELQWGALITLVGIFLGNYAYAVIHSRYLKFTIGTCVDD